MPPEIPSQIGPYRVTELLGRGGSSPVFKAVDPKSGRPVVVRLLSSHMLENPAAAQRFERESRSLMTAPHPNLLQILDTGTEGSRPYLVTEWVQGRGLDNVLKERRLSVTEILAVLDSVRRLKGIPPFQMDAHAVNCHHNNVSKEHHYGKDVLVTRKGAVRAGRGQLGIIPGSMGARSYIVRGLGNPDSFESCSHGAGRTMSRTEARKRFTVAQHAAATEGVECRKDADVIDETPAAYKDIDAVMAAQRDLVEVAYTLKQVLCVKG